MSRGKHLSLEEARNTGNLDQFAEEHPSVGEEGAFDALLGAMAGKKPSKKIEIDDSVIRGGARD